MRLSSSLFAVAAVASALSVAACSSSSPSSPTSSGGEGEGEGAVGTQASPIINGTLDTTHQAVVALLLQKGNEQGVCSGTIVKTDPATGIGWVLTAAHCVNDVPPIFAFQGNDFTAASALRYEVLDYVADPGYSGQTASPHDFGMVRILGVDATTPTIPIVTAPDGLARNTAVVSVGYGRTSLIAAGDGDTNTLRRKVSMSVDAVTTSSIEYDMRLRGICQGDSGGPVLVTSGGVEKVAGVHSYVSGDCNGEGSSGRVTYAMSFITTQLGASLPKRDCNLCTKVVNSGAQTCAQKSADCLADAKCGGLYECLAKGTARATCLKQFPEGEGPLNAATSCACNEGCATECAGALACRDVPKCGYELPAAGDCATCSEGACCDETAACAADGECFLCLKNADADPACATNAKRKAMATCVAGKCNTECADTGLTAGADPVVTEEPAAPAGAGTTTVTKSGCAVSTSIPRGTSTLGYLALLGVVVTIARARARKR